MTDEQRDDLKFAKWFGITQVATLAPLVALVLCPPAAIPLAAASAGVWKTYLKRDENRN